MKPGDWIVLGALSFLAFLFILPIAWWAVLSVGSSASIARQGSLWEIWIPTEFRLFENLQQAFSLYPLGEFLVNSLFVAFTITGIELILASLAGYGLAKYTFRGNGVLIAVILAFLIMPQIVLVIPLFEISVELGLVNTYLGLILPFMVTPFGIFLMRQFLLAFPRDYIEAARIDGASELGIFFRIVLPLSRNALATLAVFTFLFQWEALLWPLVLLSDESLYTIPVGIALLRSDVLVPFNALYAVTLVFSLPIIVLYLFAQRLVIRSLAFSGIKG